MPEYVTKDSGARQDFATGSRRDTQDGKPRFDLISTHALARWAGLMERGATKYGSRNWELGQPLARYEASLWRHLVAYMDGDRVEDHLAAVLFNAGAIMDHEARIARGELSAELDDRPAIRRTADELAPAAGGLLAVGTRVRVTGDDFRGDVKLHEWPGTIARVDRDDEVQPYYVALDFGSDGEAVVDGGHVWASVAEVRAS